MLLSLSACSGEGEVSEKPTESDEAPAHTHTDEELAPDAAPDFTVYNKEGNPVKLSDMKGTPVVLNFWASWCPPCKSEMPDFDEIAKEYEGKVVFMMVNLTDGTQETQESAQSFIDSMGYTFPVYFDKDSDAAYKYGIQSIPTTFFIDAKGNLIAYGEGAMDGDTLKRGISMIYAEKE
jgi:thiol-disulfide isomerase/thioredoxin